VRAAPPPAAIVPPPPATRAGPEALAKLLSETDVYVKYGLHAKALDHLKKVLALDPELPEAHERARDIHVGARRPADAAREAALAVRLHAVRGQLDPGRDAYARLREIAPAHPELRELNALLSSTEEVDLGTGDEELLAEGELEEAALEDIEEGAPLEIEDDALALALAAAGGGDEELVDDEPPLAAPGPEDDEELALAAARSSLEAEDEVVDEPLAAPPPRAAPAARAAPPPRAAPPRAAPPRAAPPPPPRAAARRAPPPPEPEGEEVDLSDEIGEAEFFVEQGLLDEARDALQNLLAFYPGHPAVRAKLAEVEKKARPAKAPPAPAAATDGDDAFDIARELADELGPAAAEGSIEDEFQYSVEDVFSQFKRGVEQTVKKEDSATHYDLGIAYKEMGLVDDAINEFETALGGNDRKREVDCLSMIGLCRMQKGEAAEAVKAYRRALGSDHLTKDSAKAIHYDLAAAYEQAGDRDAALYYFQRVARADAAYRDAAKQIARLGGGPGRAPPEEARPAGVPRGGPSAATPRVPASAGGAQKKNIGYL